MKYYLGIDLGGTNIVSGIVDEDYNIIATAKTKTKAPRPSEEIVKDMEKTAREAVASAQLTMDDIEYIGIGSPGVIDSDQGVVILSGNLAFRGAPIGRQMEERIGKKVYLDNDANCAALGEYLAGIGRDTDCHSLVVITLGTGVGGGLIVDGKIYSGFNYAAPEMGHMVVEKDGWPCTCGRNGCFEAYSSATGLIRMTKEEMEKRKDTKLWELAENDISKVNGKTSFDAMRLGDPGGIAVVEKYVDYLANGIASIINIIQPTILCIGGGISKEKDYLIKPLVERVRIEEFSRFCKDKTEICVAKLGNDAGIIGAAMLGSQHNQ